jgi:hypothetical protein
MAGKGKSFVYVSRSLVLHRERRNLCRFEVPREAASRRRRQLDGLESPACRGNGMLRNRLTVKA